MQSFIHIRLSTLASILFLASCSGSFEKEAQQSLRFVQIESERFHNLEKTSLEFEAIPLKSNQHLSALTLLNEQFESYLKSLYAFQKLLKNFRSISSLQSLRGEYEKLDKKIRTDWEQKLRPEITKLLNRNTDLKFHLTTWDFADLVERVEDVTLLKQIPSTEPSTLHFRVDLPTDNIETLLELLFHSNASEKEVKIPSLDKFSMTFTIQSDLSFRDTQQACLDLLPTFEDKNCASDFKIFCEKKESRQLIMSCVEKVVQDYKKADCRVRKAGFFSDEIDNSLEESTEAKRLYNSLVDCRSKDAVLN